MQIISRHLYDKIGNDDVADLLQDECAHFNTAILGCCGTSTAVAAAAAAAASGFAHNDGGFRIRYCYLAAAAAVVVIAAIGFC